MTVIATDGKTMAGDGRSADLSGTICSETLPKVRRLKDGRVLGLAGTPFDMVEVEQWFNDGEQGDFPNVDDKAFDCLVLAKDGTVRCYCDRGTWTEEMLPAAIGSGMDLAIGAMEAGASPKQAVQIACERHVGCGGKIVELRPK